MSELSNIEKDILAEGKKLADLAKKGALEVRRLNLLAVIEDIEAELKKLAADVNPKPAPAPAPAPTKDEPKAAAKPADKPAEKPAAKEDAAKE